MNYILKFGKLLEQRKYCSSTIKSYVHVVEVFFKETKSSPNNISEKEIETYIAHNVNHKKISPSFQKHILFALKLFFKHIMKKDLNVNELLPKDCKSKPPTILSQCEVKLILDSCSNLKHNAILSIIYSSGLKLSEVVNLRLTDIDFDNKYILVMQSTGNRHRLVPLCDKLIDKLKDYIKQYKPDDWLFAGMKGRKYSKRSVQQIFNNCLYESKIRKRATVQTLRHSYAAHLVESGTDIRIIQELLGHNCLKSTKIYCSIASAIKSHIKSPFETLSMFITISPVLL